VSVSYLFQTEEGYCLGTLTGMVEWIANIDPVKDLEPPLPQTLLDRVSKFPGYSLCNLPCVMCPDCLVLVLVTRSVTTAAASADKARVTPSPLVVEVSSDVIVPDITRSASVTAVTSGHAHGNGSPAVAAAAVSPRATISHTVSGSAAAAKGVSPSRPSVVNWREKSVRRIVDTLSQSHRAAVVAEAHQDTLKRMRTLTHRGVGVGDAAGSTSGPQAHADMLLFEMLRKSNAVAAAKGTHCSSQTSSCSCLMR